MTGALGGCCEPHLGANPVHHPSSACSLGTARTGGGRLLRLFLEVGADVRYHSAGDHPQNRESVFGRAEYDKASAMTPMVRMVHAIVTALLYPVELETVEEAPKAGGVQVDILVRGKRAAGAIIGRAGETITAIRHLAMRAGKIQKPAVQVQVEVRNQEEETTT